MISHRPNRSGLLDQIPERQGRDVALHNNSKSLIYLIHGVTGTPAEMSFLAHGLARRGWDVYVTTLPGHCGRLRDLTRTTERQWREHVYTQLSFAKKHYESVFVAGLSVGALLALDAALAIPLSGIGVLSPTFVYDGWNTPWSHAILPIAMRLVPRQLQHVFFHRDGPPYGIKDPELQAQVRKAYRFSAVFREWVHAWWPLRSAKNKTTPSRASSSTGYPIFPLSTFGQIQRLIHRVSESMRHVAAPALILQSQDDDMTSPRNAQMVYDAIRSKTKDIVLLDDCYHVITVDKQKDAVVKHLHDFFASLPSPA